jgi:hypothetical protein
VSHLSRLLFLTSCAIGLACGYDYSPPDGAPRDSQGDAIFPKPKGEGPVIVTYSLIFEPGARVSSEET